MTLSVRIPEKVEQELAEYCIRNKVSKSEVVKDALDLFLSSRQGDKTPYDLVRDLIGPDTDESPKEEIAQHTKRLLRERLPRRVK